MVGECRWNPYRAIEIRHRVVRPGPFGALDFAFHLADAVEVLVQPDAIGTAHALLELCNVRGERIQQACPIVERGAMAADAALPAIREAYEQRLAGV